MQLLDILLIYVSSPAHKLYVSVTGRSVTLDIHHAYAHQYTLIKQSYVHDFMYNYICVKVYVCIHHKGYLHIILTCA